MDKAVILDLVQQKVNQKILDLEKMIQETRNSNNETKSSMGDKYETGREMLQQEINHLQRQVKVNTDYKNLVNKITIEICSEVKNGALVQTDKGYFYVAIAYGELIFEGVKIFLVSTDAPLVKAMWGKRNGDRFEINTVKQEIMGIW